MQSLVKEYPADSNGANKHKTNSYKLFKRNHVKNVQVKPDIKGTQVLFIERSVTLLHQDETSSIQVTCICHNYMESLYMENVTKRLELVDITNM